MNLRCRPLRLKILRWGEQSSPAAPAPELYLYAFLYSLDHTYPHLVLLWGGHHPLEEIIDLLVKPENKRDRNIFSALIQNYLLSQTGRREDGALTRLKSTATVCPLQSAVLHVLDRRYHWYSQFNWVLFTLAWGREKIWKLFSECKSCSFVKKINVFQRCFWHLNINLVFW